jgi:hypothetical protein
LGRLVDREDNLDRAAAFAAVDGRGAVLANRIDEILEEHCVAVMADRRGVGGSSAGAFVDRHLPHDRGVAASFLGEIPMLDVLFFEDSGAR